MNLPESLYFETTLKKREHLIEMKITSFYSTLNIVLWNSDDILYIAIPMSEVSCSLAYPSDVFWNHEQLSKLLDNPVDGMIIALAIKQETDLILRLKPR